MKNSNQNSEVKSTRELLMSQAQEITKETLKSRSSKTSTNDYLLKILLDKRMTKKQVVDIMLVERLIEKIGEEELLKTSKEDYKKLVLKEEVTAGNAFDTATCNGNNNSVFRFNPEYSKYELTKHEDKTYEIKLK